MQSSSVGQGVDKVRQMYSIKKLLDWGHWPRDALTDVKTKAKACIFVP